MMLNAIMSQWVWQGQFVQSGCASSQITHSPNLLKCFFAVNHVSVNGLELVIRD